MTAGRSGGKWMNDERAGGTLVLNDPLKMGRLSDDLDEVNATLVLIYPPGPNLGRRFALRPDDNVIGRLAEADVCVDEDSVSRQHAHVRHDGQGWYVEDMGSTNGSYVNDERIERARTLRDGDFLRFGVAILKFLTGSNLEASYHEEIYRMTILDGLTGVHNKRYFIEFTERELARAQRYRSPLGLVMFDIDHFKQINDRHGHLCGDSVLRELGRRLRGRVRREDLVARYGGEEFACVLTNTPLAGAVTFAEQIRGLVARDSFRHEALIVPVTVSLGVSVTDGTRPCTVDELVQRADENLYKAKRGGRNRVVS